MKKIYLDNAATTPIDKNILADMNRCYKKYWGNPSSIHSIGIEADKILENCRTKILNSIGAKKGSVIFTSGSTESNNLIINGNPNLTNDFLFSPIEHPSLYNLSKHLFELKYNVQYCKVDENGIIDYADLLMKLDSMKNPFVSIMFVNNEVGSLQPIRDIANAVHARKGLLHVDATQAINNIKINIEDLDLDFMSVSAHKFYGPKGIGFLYYRKQLLSPLMYGGEQEGGARPGTYNLPAILGMTNAIINAQDEEKIKKENIREFELAKYFWIQLTSNIHGVRLNGPAILKEDERVPSIINIRFEDIPSESIATMLDFNNICVGLGSACSGSSFNPSHVLLAMGKSEEEAKNGIRFSFGKYTKKKDIDYTVKKIIEIINSINQFNIGGQND